MITLKLQKFSQFDPVLIGHFSKKSQSDPVLIRAHFCWPWIWIAGVDSGRFVGFFLYPDPESKIYEKTDPVSNEISDLTPYAHAQSNALHTKYAEKFDDYCLGFGV